MTVTAKPTRIERYERLVERGCHCGSDRPADCPIHVEPGDLRGLRAYFEAGQPLGFPMVAHCALCGTQGFMYPNVELDDPKRSGEYRPTLICPRHSVPSQELELRTDAERFEYSLNGRRVFAEVSS